MTGQRSTSGRGRPAALSGALLALTAVLGLLAALTANRWLVLAAGAVGGLLVVGRLLQPDLSALEVHWDGADRVRAGEVLPGVVHLHHRGRRPLPGLQVVVGWPGTEAPVTVDVGPLAPGQRARAPVRPRALRRGVHHPASAVVRTRDPLGLRTAELVVTSNRPLVVHPAAAEALVVPLSAVPGDLVGRASTRASGDLAGLRPWRSGDEQRDVAWRASARRARLVVVERDESQHPRRAVLAVVGSPRTPQDEALLASAAASWLQLVVQGAEVHVTAWPGGVLEVGPVGPSASPVAVLDWCSALHALAVPSAFQLLEALPAGTTALSVVASSEVPSGWLDSAQQHLRRHGVRVSALAAAADA